MNKLTDTFTLRNGVEIPCVGFGTWQTPDGETAVKAVKSAIESGYHHIDAAAVYANESGVGQGIQESGIARKDLFVTSKVWNTDRGYSNTMKAFEKTLSDLKLDYLDLYLIHWPANAAHDENWKATNLDTWKALTELYKAKKVRAIGVSNFLPHHLEALAEAEVQPMVDQIEFHPGFIRQETIDYCRKHDIVVEAWSPMGSGEMLKNTTIRTLADKYGKTPAHICIRWCIQHEVIPLPKSVTPSRILDNTKVFDFALSVEDMAIIDAMKDCGWSGNDPDTFAVGFE